MIHLKSLIIGSSIVFGGIGIIVFSTVYPGIMALISLIILSYFIGRVLVDTHPEA